MDIYMHNFMHLDCKLLEKRNNVLVIFVSLKIGNIILDMVSTLKLFIGWNWIEITHISFIELLLSEKYEWGSPNLVAIQGKKEELFSDIKHNRYLGYLKILTL